MNTRYAESRLKHAVQLWRSYLDAEQFPQLDRWLSAEMRKHRQFGKQDRDWYSETLFTAVRFGYLPLFFDFLRKREQEHDSLDWRRQSHEILETFSAAYAEPSAFISAWKRIPTGQFFYMLEKRYAETSGDVTWPAAAWLKPKEIQMIDRLFDELQRYRKSSNDLRAELLWQGIPVMFAKQLSARQAQSRWSSAELTTFLRQQSFRPPLWIRFNHLDRKAEALAEFAQHQMHVAETNGAFWVQGEKGIFELRAHKTGVIEIQDWASQRIGACVDAKPGEFVWDCCAGGGGKTLQIASKMYNHGAVYASDIREYKLNELRQRSNRARLHNIRTIVWDGDTLPELPKEVSRHGGFDWVLVDAPCTSTGTWRRNPDAKFRVTADSLSEMTALQAQLLHRASELVRRDGRLVYGTCSWLVEENETIIGAFLRQHRAFRLINQRLHGSPYANADTMFSAVMQRVA